MIVISKEEEGRGGRGGEELLILTSHFIQNSTENGLLNLIVKPKTIKLLGESQGKKTLVTMS